MSGAKEALTIVICSDFGAVTGGQAKVAIESAIGLKKQGHRVLFFAATGPADTSLAEAGIEVHCLGQHDLLGNPSRIAAAVQGTWNWAAAAALDRLLDSLPRENTVIHVHSWAKALSPLIAQPIRKSGLPAVYTLHEFFLSCPNGGFYNYQKSEVCTLTPLSPQCWLTHCDAHNYARKLWRNARLLYAQKLARLPEAFSDFITISAFQRRIVEPYIPAGARLHRLSNPVNVEDPGQKSDPTAGDIVFVGRLSPEKGTFLFAEAARKIGLVPTFVGDGPIAADLAARFPEARLLGWQKEEAVRRLMRNARALVFPSLWYEGQPLTILEAKALGLPIVVADTCAGSDEVEDGVTGLWFKSGDVDDLARALAELRDDARVTAMSHAASRAYWAEPKTLDRHVDGLLSIYRGMLDARRSAVAGRQPIQNRAAPIEAAAP
ncbi:glycosyltransferase family 4 protein [Methylovirgula sp. HY1]|uniref:glycosyltransferase family 4 protein n=1 Tax=Methylovirgula sp. HY1 TaxID=2822761 RepID=UPI001C773DA4|nr:glycosyltransferase family 4 protein [Methylovirgula sp. HY1]QXX73889.1 Putative glycosyltransferase EpsF [Methylovirgula sp. HY1]